MNKIIGYLILITIGAGLAYSYLDRSQLWQPDIADLLALAASSAVIVMTVSVFWLWRDERVRKLESWFGPLGHVPHCGYCFSLWIAAFYTAVFGINLISGLELPRFISMLISWWALGFINVLFFTILNALWFKKLAMEFKIRDFYKQVQDEHQH